MLIEQLQKDESSYGGGIEVERMDWKSQIQLNDF